MSMTLGDFKKVAFSRASDTLIVLNNGSTTMNGEFVYDSGVLVFVIDFDEKNEYSLGRLFDLISRHENEINDSTVMETYDPDDSYDIDFTEVRVEDGVIVIYMD